MNSSKKKKRRIYSYRDNSSYINNSYISFIAIPKFGNIQENAKQKQMQQLPKI